MKMTNVKTKYEDISYALALINRTTVSTYERASGGENSQKHHIFCCILHLWTDRFDQKNENCCILEPGTYIKHEFAMVLRGN